MRPTYDTPVVEPASTPMEVNGGFLCRWTYWRPNPDDPAPDMPGLKQHLTMYIAVRPDATACVAAENRTAPVAAGGAPGIRSARIQACRAIAFSLRSALHLRRWMAALSVWR